MAEEVEAAKSAHQLFESYYARIRDLPHLVAERSRGFDADGMPRDPDHPWNEEMRLSLDRSIRREVRQELRAPLKAHFDQALRRGGWVAFGFSEKEDRRVRIHSPWREGLEFDDKGGMTDRSRQTHSEVLFYGTTAPLNEPNETVLAEKQEADEGQPPRDTSALRVKAAEWLATFVTEGKHVRREDTLEKMRDAHPGLSIRGSYTVFWKYSRENPTKNLSVRGRKSKRDANN